MGSKRKEVVAGEIEAATAGKQLNGGWKVGERK